MAYRSNSLNLVTRLDCDKENACISNRLQDREQAIADLQSCASFAPVGFSGPFNLRLGIKNGRLILDVRDADDGKLHLFAFSLSSLKRLIKDYNILVDSFDEAMRDSRMEAVQTIDMGRRSLHDEGAILIMQRFEGKIVIDFETARRLFTLVYVMIR